MDINILDGKVNGHEEGCGFFVVRGRVASVQVDKRVVYAIGGEVPSHK